MQLDVQKSLVLPPPVDDVELADLDLRESDLLRFHKTVVVSKLRKISKLGKSYFRSH